MPKNLTRLPFSARFVVAMTAAPFICGAAQASDVGARFVHVVTAENSSGISTKLDHPLTNNDETAIIHVTQNWNPPGTSGTYNISAIGLTYDTSESKWEILNKQAAAIPLGASFNIWIPAADSSTFVHTSDGGSITNNHTVIDHPLTNSNPDAVLLVTQNFFAAGGSAYNPHRIGVWYNGSAWSIFNQDLAAMPVHASFNVTVLPDEPTAAVHTATPSNTIGNWTSIDHPHTNNNPNSIVSITQNWNPGGIGGIYNDRAVGVWYHDGIKRWAVFNQDGAPMPNGASFNVSAPSRESALFVHTAGASNINLSLTGIDHHLIDGNPHAMLFVTQNWNPGGGVGGVYNDRAVGVWYSPVSSTWTISNQDSADMPEGASFNVSIPAVDASNFSHTATTGNTSGSLTYLDNPVTNGNPNAIIHVTQNLKPPGASATFNDHAIGVYYSDLAAMWAVHNQDYSPIPLGASFNISIPAIDAATFVHTATAGNITHNHTVIDHPVSNNNPDAIVRVTLNVNPGGSFGVTSNHEIGVWYNGSAWAIFNQDSVPMPVGASFNVTVVGPPLFSDGFESGDTSAWSAVVP